MMREVDFLTFQEITAYYGDVSFKRGLEADTGEWSEVFYRPGNIVIGKCINGSRYYITADPRSKPACENCEHCEYRYSVGQRYCLLNPVMVAVDRLYKCSQWEAKND